jgi:hypothetical protein
MGLRRAGGRGPTTIAEFESGRNSNLLDEKRGHRRQYSASPDGAGRSGSGTGLETNLPPGARWPVFIGI